MATYAPINYAPPQGTAGAPQMIAAPTFQLPQLQAFSKGAQYTEAGANLANMLLEAYLKKQELNKAEAAESELADLLAIMDVSQDPSISAGPVQDPTAYAAPSQADQYQFVAKELIGSDLAANRARGIDMLTAALLKEPKKLTREEQIGEVLQSVATTKQAPAFGPLADPEQAFSDSATIELPLSPVEQMRADEAAVRGAGLGDLDLSRERARLAMGDEFAQIKEERQPNFRVGEVIARVPRSLEIEGEMVANSPMRTLILESNALRKAGLPVERAGASVGLTWDELNKQRAEYRAEERAKAAELRKQNLAKDLEEWKTNLAKLDPQKQMEGAQKLRKEFTDIAGEFIDAKSAFERLNASTDDAYGDIALITGYMKVLDPSSIVRETEFDQVAYAASVPNKLRNMYQRMLSGERLSTEQRDDLKAAAKAIFEPLAEDHKRIEKRFTELANRYGFEIEEIILPYRESLDIDEQPIVEQTANNGAPLQAIGTQVRESDVGSNQIVEKNGLAYKNGKLFSGRITVNGMFTDYENGRKVIMQD